MLINESQGNLADGLSQQALLRPDATAVHLPTRVVTFRQMENLVWRTAMFLHGQSIQPGDVVALTFINELTLIVAMLATARIGATAFSVPRATPAIQQSEMLLLVNAKYMATDIVGTNLEGLVTLLLDIEALFRESIPIDKSLRDGNPHAPWLISMGSGSTGRPKQIPVSHSLFQARMALYSDQIPPSSSDRVASLIHSDFPTAKYWHLHAIFSGASICLFDRGNTNPIELCRNKKVTVLYSAIVHVEQLINQLQSESKNALGSLRALVPVGSIVNDDLRKRILVMLTPNLYVRYGTNETGPITIAVPGEVLSVAGTVGRPSSGVQLEIVDSEGKPLPTGEIGQIRLRSAGIIDHYQNDTAANERAFKNGWFMPGDVGKFTSDGQLIFMGRSDQMMIMDGINIYPAEIESTIARHPAVCDQVALPLHSPLHQDIPVCAVALYPKVKVTEKELLEFAFQRLGSRYPRRIIILEKLPRTENGKLLLQQLTHAVAEKLRSPA
ncbi:MAG: acyl--CoA ligase [Rhodocyclaceae bacterium]|nr:acyl--CoA ligase [Rhodocyclaceae bacterium]